MAKLNYVKVNDPCKGCDHAEICKYRDKYSQLRSNILIAVDSMDGYEDFVSDVFVKCKYQNRHTNQLNVASNEPEHLKRAIIGLYKPDPNTITSENNTGLTYDE